MACISVSMETMSPDSMVSFGFSFGSSHPHATVSGVAVSRYVFGVDSACAAAESTAAPSSTWRTTFIDMVRFPSSGCPGWQRGGG